jgi:group I intron endonuclease
MSNIKKEHKYYFIYMIKNIANGKCYVGFHTTDKEYDKDPYFGSSVLLKMALKKYGKENFIMGVLEYISSEDWKQKERYWIEKMNAHVSQGGYNLTWGGEGTLGMHHSDDSKEQNRKAHLGKLPSEITRGKMSNSHIGIKQHSEEFKKKVSQNNKLFNTGKIASEQTKEKMSEKRRGVKKSEAWKEIMRAKKVEYWKNKKVSNDENTRAKAS